MTKALFDSWCRRRSLSTLAGLALCLQSPLVAAQDVAESLKTEIGAEQTQKQTLSSDRRTQVTYDAYILGPGDGLQIELLDLPQLSGYFSIGPDGTLYLPRLRAIYVEGLTVEDLRRFLTQQFSTYVRDPQVYVRPVVYRPIRIYVSGEVKRPGYYTLAGVRAAAEDIDESKIPVSKPSSVPRGSISTTLFPTVFDAIRSAQDESKIPVSKPSSVPRGSISTTLFPTVFDAIRSAQGVTPYTDLSQVEVIRKRAESLGGGRIRTNLNFLSLITEGDDSQNIRLFDGDALKVRKSPVVLRDQLLKAGQSNLNPQFMNVFVTGRVNNPGGVMIPQGGTLNLAISLAGGTKILKGKVEFVRFNPEGTIDRRIFPYNPRATADAPNNPILAAGDLIRINDSIFSGSVEVLNELTGPFVGLYSIYSLFNGN